MKLVPAGPGQILRSQQGDLPPWMSCKGEASPPEVGSSDSLNISVLLFICFSCFTLF